MSMRKLESIRGNYINGNKRVCVKGIDNYGSTDFFSDFRIYLDEMYCGDYKSQHKLFTDMTISYFRFKQL